MPDKIAPATPRALSLAATGFGSILANVFIYHAGHFGVNNELALDKISKLARDMLDVPNFMSGTPEEVADARRVIEDILLQSVGHARKHMGLKPDRKRDEMN